MKFQSIFHYILLIVVIRNGDARQPTGKLTPEENTERLRTCGTRTLDRPSADGKAFEVREDSFQKWLSFVEINNAQNRSATGGALGTMISSRHFLTSSQVVMNDDKTWRWNSEKVADCVSGQNHLDVPDEILGHTNLFFRVCVRRTNSFCELTQQIEQSVKRAVILNYCNHRTQYFDNTQAVMVAEVVVDHTPNRGFPCLVDATTAMHVKTNDLVDVYTISAGNGKDILRHRRLQIIENGDDLFYLPVFHDFDTRGGPIMNYINQKWTLIGLGTVGDPTYSLAFNISSLENDLCDEVGVCGLGSVIQKTEVKPEPQMPPPPPIPPPQPPTSLPHPPADTPPPAPPTDIQQPSLPGQTPEPMPVPTPATAGTPSESPEAAAPPPTPPPEPSTEAPPPRAPPARRGKDDEEKDDEYEMHLKRKKEKEEAAMYEDEDTDILISKDDYWFSGIDRCGGDGLGRLIIILCLFWFLLFV